jgi:excinuclease ABC subunit C
LEKPPNRVECYDISNTQGTFAVGSMVVFEKGTPNKKLYRRFNIKTVVGPDDFASMEEVLARRFKRWEASQIEETVGKKLDPSFGVLPDLLVVDGGKGQLSRAVKILKEFNLNERVTAVGLAKQHELIFIPTEDVGIELPRNSQGLFLMQRIRDEAHRFAITAHRNRRSKDTLVSRLDQISGIGPERRKALLKKFGSIKNIGAASRQELAQIPGITLEFADKILDSLNHL